MDPATLPALWLALPLTGIVFAAAVVQFGLGFGFGMVAAPLLALIDPAMVPAPVLMIGLVTSAMAAWRERAAIAWGEVWTATLGRATWCWPPRCFRGCWRAMRSRAGCAAGSTRAIAARCWRQADWPRRSW